MSVRVVTLGEFRVLVYGEDRSQLLGQRVRCAFLVYLAVERNVTRDHLMGLLWPDKAPEKARHSLSQTVYALKKDLGDGWLDVQGEVLLATDELEADAVDLQVALDGGHDAAALTLYRGGFLHGANLAPSRSYEGWVDRVRARTARQHRNAASRVVQAREAAGDVMEALAVARAWVDGDPLDDEGQHVLIGLLARAGRRSAALRQYDRYAELLHRELEVEPLEQTRDLVTQIREESALDSPLRPPAPSVDEEAARPLETEQTAGLSSPDPSLPVPPAGPSDSLPPTGVGGAVAPGPSQGGQGAPQPSPPQTSPPRAAPTTALEALIQFADELSRRRVNRVAVAYLVAGLATLEGADLLLRPLGVPAWFSTALSVVVLLGFPVVLTLAWVFDVTPRGLEVTPRTEGAAGAVASRIARRGLVGVVVVSIAGMAALWTWQRTGALPDFDVNRVMVFPLVSPSMASADQASIGEDVATMIGHALDRTGPLRWIDGWNLLQPEERSNIRELTNEEARALAADRACAYYVRGRVVQLGATDSTRVFLELWDAAGDSTVASSDVAGLTSETWQSGLRAVNDLLPRILGGPISNQFAQEVLSRKPAAVASFLLGEQAFRRARGGPALLNYQAALAEDSLFGLAAIRGAQAAAWEHDYGAMADLAHVALSLDLTPSERQTSIGMVAYSEGRADSANAAFDRAIEADSANALAWAQKGEVHSHLAPRTPRPDSVAEHAFTQARAIDPRGVNTSFHLLVDALTSGNLPAADLLRNDVLDASPGSEVALEIEILDQCARSPMSPREWSSAMSEVPYLALEVAKQFARGGRNMACAEGGFRAVLLAEGGGLTNFDHQAALRGLLAVLLNSGRSNELLALLDASTRSLEDVRAVVRDPESIDPEAAGDGFLIVASTADSPNPLDGTAYAQVLILSIAGVDLGDRLDRVLALQTERYGPDFSLRTPTMGALYRIGVVAAARGDAALANQIAQLMETRLEPEQPSTSVAQTRALLAHAALATGDTTLALERFEALRTEGSIVSIAWNHTSPLPFERIVESRLLLARGGREGALRALNLSSSLDGEPLGYTPYLAESLDLRIEAAEALGQPALAEVLRNRRRALGSPATEAGS